MATKDSKATPAKAAEPEEDDEQDEVDEVLDELTVPYGPLDSDPQPVSEVIGTDEEFAALTPEERYEEFYQNNHRTTE